MKCSKRSFRALGFQSLEKREVMAGGISLNYGNLPDDFAMYDHQFELAGGIDFDFNSGVLSIYGTSEDDFSFAALFNDFGNEVVFAYLTSGDSIEAKTLELPASWVSGIRFYGFGGNDFFDNNTNIMGEAWGGAGDDKLRGGRNTDMLFGEVGNDTLFGGPGNDFLEGGRDSDSLHGEEGNDDLRGGDGADYLNGGAHSDKLFGDLGNDTLDGEAGMDQLFGGAGQDLLRGGDDDDYLYGEGDADRLFGDEGRDKLFGGLGGDFLDGGNDSQRDELSGQGGADTFVQYWSTEFSDDDRLTREELVKDFNSSAGDRMRNVYLA
jgi:Ca2+-binding RTX toxin-like protein